MALLDLVKRKGVVVSRMGVNTPTSERLIGFPYEVTGISPQSRTVAQLLKGFVSSGTLYPPLRTIFLSARTHTKFNMKTATH